MVTRVYRAREFAARAGVTVRTLHHYDRLGLLKPRRSRTGYRLYVDRDLARLEQIVVLKFIGLSLSEIRGLLAKQSELGEALRRQQRVLESKRTLIDRAIAAIAAAERSLRAQGAPDWRMFATIIEEVEMQSSTDWSKKYYSPEARARVEERQEAWSPELQAKVSAEWAALYADIDASLDADPAGPKGRELAARWRALVEGFTGGDPDVQDGLNRMWADQENWPEGLKETYAPKKPVQDWMIQALNAAVTPG